MRFLILLGLFYSCVSSPIQPADQADHAIKSLAPIRDNKPAKAEGGQDD